MKIYTSVQNSFKSPYLYEFAGKPVFVKCYDNEYRWETYIKIVSISSHNLTFCELPDHVVDEHELGLYSKEELLDELDFKYYTNNLDRFNIITPIDICTETEAYNAIMKCDDGF